MASIMDKQIPPRSNMAIGNIQMDNSLNISSNSETSAQDNDYTYQFSDIINSSISKTIYDHLIYAFKYEKCEYLPLDKTHIKILAGGIGVEPMNIIHMLMLCDWCSIKQKKSLFQHTKYYIYIKH